ncbi:MAG: deoxyguanosinetriphosphate triphosphohydrolase [Bacteroidota bacterium]|nr:deoxyguanosinetriphosphate triphosphohydrolase [Bacteroidota bacterium]
MNWQTLFSEARIGDKDPKRVTTPDRTNFERDFDRVVFSSAFRRLQDKTQVIPLPESDFVHSRLTHSLEVSCVARSLGKIAGKVIIDRYKLNLHASDFGAVCATAALAHDIGNPPFGHSGETSISDYFANGKGKHFAEAITDENKWADLTNFEGNANGFKILTNYNEASGGNINLTYTTLAAFTKYPTRSNKLAEYAALIKGKVSQKKYGYFQSEAEIFEKLFTHLEIDRLTPYSFFRHPLAYLVEAADDICYRIIDFEDGIRIGLIDFRTGEELLKAVLGKDFDQVRYDAVTDEREKISYLRAKAINTLINACKEVFLAKEKEICDGRFDSSLVDLLDSAIAAPLKEINKISIAKVYRSKNVLQIEAAGFNVVAELLDLFINAVNDHHKFGNDLRKNRPYSEKVISLLPAQFIQSSQGDLYLRILRVCEFVAGMTDSYAVTLYRRLKGIELPK